MSLWFAPKHRFDCNILHNNYMSSSGHKLRVAIQNTSTPLMDLYVRESLQNSLDAAKEGVSDVHVDYSHGEFDIGTLADFYENLGPKLKERKESLPNEYVAIADWNTIGLVGRDDGIVASYERNQNLGNLVFNIQNAQQNEGAGGFWGIGKTIFYRMSQAGLVIFYSRIKKDDGEFEERLTSVLVEDEQKRDECFLSEPEYIGISFYGINKRHVDGGQTRTIIVKDHSFCEELLNVFGLTPYDGMKTGTIVIVPFVDGQKVCSQHPEYTQHENRISISWAEDFEEYLKTCILRWYIPRLSKKYQIGPRLIATVNGQRVKASESDPFFSYMNLIYEAISSFQSGQEAPSNIEGLHLERIQAGRGYTHDNTLGWLGFIELSGEELGILGSAPGALGYHPAIYAGLENGENGEVSFPIIAYCRKPGMIISYNTKNDWSANTDVPVEHGKYVIGLFVLNSEGGIIHYSQTHSLEEYIRSGEKADHCEWFDHPLGDDGKKRKAVEIMRNIVSNKLKDCLAKKEESDVELSNNYIWQKKLSSWLPSGQGKRSSPITQGDEGGEWGDSVHLKNIKCKIYDGVVFVGTGLTKKFEIIAKAPFNDFAIEAGLDSSTSTVTAEKIEDYGLKLPFSITKFFIQFDKGCANKSLQGEVAEIDCRLNEGCIFGCLNYKLKTTHSGVVYGISFSSNEESLRFKIGVTIDIFDQDAQLVYTTKIGEVN